MKSVLVWGAAVMCAVGAVAAALLAHDVRAWSQAFATGDVRARAGRPTQWRPATVFPAGWSEGILGVGRDRSLRLAIRRFDQTYATLSGLNSGLDAVKARDAAESALGAAGSDSDPARASQALDLLALLLFGDSSAGGGSAAAIRAVDDLTQAVRLAPANVAAKANLELVLRLLEAHGTRVGPSTAAGPHSSGHHGAGAGVAGEGY